MQGGCRPLDDGSTKDPGNSKALAPILLLRLQGPHVVVHPPGSIMLSIGVASVRAKSCNVGMKFYSLAVNWQTTPPITHV